MLHLTDLTTEELSRLSDDDCIMLGMYKGLDLRLIRDEAKRVMAEKAPTV